ncbi:MAG: LysM peptidoglycan-binding domain-containing protein [Verrucomicrobiales bacterium]
MRFKILIFVLSLAFLAGTFLAAYWFYDTIDQPERQAEQALARRVRQAATQPPPDPAASSYQKALAALEAGEIDSAHEQLTRLLKVYPSSPRIPEVQRMLGEINLDRLFSRSPMPGKRDYIVKPGDSLARIEKGSLTTIPFLKQLNQLSGLNLQPGDRLVYQPLEFEIEIDLAKSTLTVRQKGAAGLEPAFFKEYSLIAVALPPQFPKTLTTQIQEKPTVLDGKKVLTSDPKYAFTRKRLVTTIRPGRANLMIRPDSDRHESPPATPPPAGSAPPAAATHGVFLADGDIEELSTILRIGTPVVVHR